MLILRFSADTRRFLAISALLLIGLLADVVLNDLNVHALSDHSGNWSYPATVPTLGEHGADLRILKHGSEQITHGINPYGAEVPYPPPPFAAVFFYPFTLMSEGTAYLVQYRVLIALNLASIGLIAFCLFMSSAQSAEASEPAFPMVATGVLATIVALSAQFRGYGLEFALERGNFDSYVLFLAAAAIACMIIWPQRVFVPVVLLSAASHLKIYPAILLLLPLLQSWRRAIAPLVVVNLAMLFVFGVAFARAFFGQIVGYANAPFNWPGNHSIAAYVSQVIVPGFPSPLHNSDLMQTWASRAIAFVVVGIWLHGIIRVRALTPLSRRWLVMAALSFPVMGALSSTSHDYKLVIYVLPLLVNLYLYCEAYLSLGSLASLAGIVLTLVCSVSIGHSTIIGLWPLQETKFPVLFLLLLVGYFQTYVCRERLPARAEDRVWPPLGSKVFPIAIATGAIAIVFYTTKPASVAARATDSAGYGKIVLRLKLPGTSAGIPEPILVCGRPGNASSVYVRLLPNSQAKVGVEFWGKGAFESDPFDVLSPSALITVTCSLPCLYPDLGDREWESVPEPAQRKLHESYFILVNEVTRLEGPISYAQPAHSPRYYGRNPIGGSWVSKAFTGTVISAIQIAR